MQDLYHQPYDFDSGPSLPRLGVDRFQGAGHGLEIRRDAGRVSHQGDPNPN